MYAAKEIDVIIDGINALSAHDKSIDLKYAVSASCKTHQTDEYNEKVIACESGDDNIVDIADVKSETFSSDPSVIWVTESDTDGHETSESSIMNNTPIKRPSDGPVSLPKRYNQWSCKRKHEESLVGTDSTDICEIISLSSDDETYESAEEAVASHEIKLLTPPDKIKTTRSGRTVRAPIDNTFDYTSDPDDNTDADDDFEDDENDKDYREHDDDELEPKWMQPKQRRMWNHSCSSSSEASSRSHNEGTLYIYLDLKNSTAVVASVPSDDTTVDNDIELKTSLQKFLDLVPRTRRLYNPMDNYNIQETQAEETPVQRFICPITPNSNTPSKSIVEISAEPTLMPVTSTPNRPPSACKRRRLSRKPVPPLTDEEFGIKVLDDLVAGANACYIEKQIPDHIKEPIDLSGLPSRTERSYNCRQHKYIYGYLEVCRRFYRFFESLSTETLMNLCHPYAKPYKERTFSTCKVALAKTAFNMLNHKVFYCGLKQLIIWKRSMKNLSGCIHSIESNGQRVSKILLSENINYPSVLIKLLLHEMCHAAAFNFHGETGHGDNCRKWAYRAITEMPDLPLIEVCESRYKYICSLCSNRSYGNIRFEDEEEHLRCQYCQFDIIVEPYSADYLNRMSFTQREPTPFRVFIKQHYMETAGETHSAKMKALNANYTTMTKTMSQAHLT